MRVRQEPTYSANLPASLDGDGEDAIALASAFFGEPMPWQRLVLKVMLSRDEHDRYAASVFALSVPRQNGKSWDVRARCFYGLVCGGEKILFTCQHGDTADEMFKDLSAVFEDEDNAELHALLKAVRKTNGQQAIYLENGGCIRFTTRTNSLARGKTYDVLIYDEAQELTVAQQAASLPTISAGALGNPQTIYLGTPPDPECAGTVFRTMRDRVHGGTSTVAWMEWGATEIGDPSDEPRWYETNPSLGLRLNPDAVEDESNSMPPRELRTRALGLVGFRDGNSRPPHRFGFMGLRLHHGGGARRRDRLRREARGGRLDWLPLRCRAPRRGAAARGGHQLLRRIARPHVAGGVAGAAAGRRRAHGHRRHGGRDRAHRPPEGRAGRAARRDQATDHGGCGRRVRAPRRRR